MTDLAQHKKFELRQSLKQAAIIGAEQALSQAIAMGSSAAVSQAAFGNISYITYPVRFMRPPLNYAWSQLFQ